MSQTVKEIDRIGLNIRSTSKKLSVRVGDMQMSTTDIKCLNLLKSLEDHIEEMVQHIKNYKNELVQKEN